MINFKPMNKNSRKKINKRTPMEKLFNRGAGMAMTSSIESLDSYLMDFPPYEVGKRGLPMPAASELEKLDAKPTMTDRDLEVFLTRMVDLNLILPEMLPTLRKVPWTPSEAVKVLCGIVCASHALGSMRSVLPNFSFDEERRRLLARNASRDNSADGLFQERPQKAAIPSGVVAILDKQV